MIQFAFRQQTTVAVLLLLLLPGCHLHSHSVFPCQVHKVVALQQLVGELGEADA